MKRLYFAFIALVLISGLVKAQGIPCPMSPWQESFPYWFCPITGGTPTVICSMTPDTQPLWVASKVHMPGCINLVPLDTTFWFQPDGPNPPFTEEPPNKETIWEGYVEQCIDNGLYFPPPWSIPYDGNESDWDHDETAYEAGLSQWNEDSSNFFNNLGPIMNDTSVLDADAQGSTINYYRQDNEIWRTYDEEYSTYQSDSTRWAGGLDQPWNQIWHTGDANSDANHGINAWEACCGVTGDASCCVLIKPNNVPSRWPGNYGPPGPKVKFGLGFTFGLGSDCINASSCPDSSKRFIIYNTTNSFFYQNNQNEQRQNNSNLLHPLAPLSGFYSGMVPNIGEAGYYIYSFRQTIEHEEGHWLEMNHPERLSSDSASCLNNETQCLHSIDFPMLMSTFGVTDNAPPEDIQPDDRYMFQKLYCPDLISGVAPVREPNIPQPIIFPNPTTGACQLQYEVPDHAFVQVAIYNEIGTLVKMVSSNYEDEGQQTISLGTENFVSGNYVCRVRVGDRVSYINLEVRK